MLGFLKKEIHEPIELQRKDIMVYPEPLRSWILSGEDCDQLQGAYDAFGSLTNPIPVNGSIGEIKYLGKLRGRTGRALFFHRLESTNSPVCKYPVDIYETVCMDGTQWGTLHFDCYHPRRSNLAPPGYSLMSYDKRLKFDIPIAYGVDFLVKDFPYGLLDSLVECYGAEMGRVFAGHAGGHLRKVNFKRRMTPSFDIVGGMNKKTENTLGPRPASSVERTAPGENSMFVGSGSPFQNGMGHHLSTLVIGLCGHPDLKRVFQERHFTPTDVNRFRFCLLFHNIASAVWCANTICDVTDGDKTKIPIVLDEMLQDVIDTLKKDETKIKAGDFVVDRDELEFLSNRCEISNITVTSYYTLFLSLYERHANRVEQYLKAFTKRVEIAQRTRNNNKGFSHDAVAEVFVRHFKGTDWTGDLKLLLVLTDLLSFLHGQIMDYVGDKLKTRPEETKEVNRGLAPDIDKCDVLVVDDEENFRYLIPKEIQKRIPNVRIMTAEDGGQGYELASKFRPRIVWTCVRMPRMDGLEMMKLIRQNRDLKNTKILVYTGYGGEDVLKLGADILLSKGSVEEFEEALSVITTWLSGMKADTPAFRPWGRQRDVPYE